MITVKGYIRLIRAPSGVRHERRGSMTKKILRTIAGHIPVYREIRQMQTEIMHIRMETARMSAIEAVRACELDPKRAWDGTQNFGASLKALEKLGARLGYGLVGCDFTGVNAFFVRDDLLADKFAAPYTAENHYEPPCYHYLHRRGHPRAVLDRQRPDTEHER
jgi:hypothetical protein